MTRNIMRGHEGLEPLPAAVEEIAAGAIVEDHPAQGKISSNHLGNIGAERRAFHIAVELIRQKQRSFHDCFHEAVFFYWNENRFHRGQAPLALSPRAIMHDFWREAQRNRLACFTARSVSQTTERAAFARGGKRTQ